MKLDQLKAVHQEERALHNYYPTYSNGNHLIIRWIKLLFGQILSSCASVKKDFIVKRLPFRKHLIAIGCFGLLWHLWKLYGQQPLQLVTFWIPFKAVNMKVFYFTGHGTQNENNSSSYTESGWHRWKSDERKKSDGVFILYEKVINAMHRHRDKGLVWFKTEIFSQVVELCR